MFKIAGWVTPSEAGEAWMRKHSERIRLGKAPLGVLVYCRLCDFVVKPLGREQGEGRIISTISSVENRSTDFVL